MPKHDLPSEAELAAAYAAAVTVTRTVTPRHAEEVVHDAVVAIFEGVAPRDRERVRLADHLV